MYGFSCKKQWVLLLPLEKDMFVIAKVLLLWISGAFWGQKLHYRFTVSQLLLMVSG